jgi:hypothetical protein
MGFAGKRDGRIAPAASLEPVHPGDGLAIRRQKPRDFS